MAALIVHPHVVEPHRVRLRTGTWEEILIPRDAIETARSALASAPRGLTVKAGVASLTPSGTTDVVLHLSCPLAIGSDLVQEIRCLQTTPLVS